MMHWIYSAIVGIIVGLIARFLLPGNDHMSLFMTMLVGLAGSLLGTAIGHATGNIQKNAQAGWLWSIIGSILILLLLRFFSR